jgi:glycolate oxidase
MACGLKVRVMPLDRATRRLIQRLGTRVNTGDDARFRASFDGSKLSFLPDAVIKPRSDRDIAAVLALANETGMPVTVRGGGSSLTGSASPLRKGWVLDLSGWKKLKVDPVAGIAQAQAGVIVAELASPC